MSVFSFSPTREEFVASHQAGKPQVIYTKRVSGEFEEAAKETETERERPIRIWLARFDQTQVRYPGKLEATTGFGTIRGKLLYFRERPLTTAESQAMRR